MRKVLVAALAMLAVGLVIAMVTPPAFADGSGAGVVGSPHDFTDNVCDGAACAGFEVPSATGWNDREEICRVCHVPHDHNRTSQRYLNGLLWNHALSSASYAMYDSSWSSTLDGTQSAQPDGTAKLCLGCHDGTVAIDTFDKYAGGAVFISDYSADWQHPGPDIPLVGSDLDLRGTHPISIEYDPVADDNLNPKTDAMGTSGTIQDVLDHDKVQCSSCHDVHDEDSVSGTHLLRVSQSSPASGLCLTCHIK